MAWTMRQRKTHMAAKVNPAGGVSALCFATPRAISLSQATWTLRPEAVTCKRCQQALRDQALQDLTPPQQPASPPVAHPRDHAAAPGGDPTTSPGKPFNDGE